MKYRDLETNYNVDTIECNNNTAATNKAMTLDSEANKTETNNRLNSNKQKQQYQKQTKSN
jgi:hypothetical protein